jgi:multicomponent Na+:H+ antiporter subunit D
VESGFPLAYVGIGCLLLSALLTAIYMLNVVIRGFFPKAEFDYNTISEIKDPTWKMCFPLVVCAGIIIFLGLGSTPFVTFFENVATGLL